MKRVLITGGAGFLGFNLARYLVSKGCSVVVYDNKSRRGSEKSFHRLNQLLGIECVTGSLDDFGDFYRTRGSFDVIYHFAAQVAVTQSYQSPENDFRVNALGTLVVARAARDTPVIYASTNKVYGNNVNNIELVERATRYEFADKAFWRGIDESYSIDTNHHTPYGCSKLTGEMYVREFGGIANRFSCMYGPNQFGNEDQGWVAHFVISAARGKPIVVYGDGKQVRDLLYVDDVVRLLEIQGNRAHELRGEVFSIGGGHENTLSVRELCDLLRVTPTYAEWRPADQKVYYANTQKALNVLGWKPHVSAEEGVRRLDHWVRQNRGLFS